MRARAIVVCDDVRYEVGNKLSLIGCYNDGIAFVSANGPLVMPKLVIVYCISGLRGISELRIRHAIQAGEDAPRLESIPAEVGSRDPTYDEQNLVFQLSPAVFPTEGIVSCALEIEGGEQRLAVEHRFSVRRTQTKTAGTS
ncbi:MAG: hypothetical protein HYY06_30315 [Deltaproteobacteria bacterium]|nr:hypothetical protein [Deltaproteobacteria bacterium]